MTDFVLLNKQENLSPHSSEILVLLLELFQVICLFPALAEFKLVHSCVVAVSLLSYRLLEFPRYLDQKGFCNSKEQGRLPET